MAFSLPAFWRFCANLSINSKEYGVVKFDKPYGPQRYFMREVARGLEEDIHDFCLLKCRQIGLSTIVLALDLYWPFTHEGLDGTIVVHDEDTYVNFRTQITEYYRSLPKAYKPRSIAHNRAEFVFRFASGVISRLQYQIAGTRASGNTKLGRAKGNAYLHATELAFWGDQQAVSSLNNSLAEMNPNRLYIRESTANGYNAFEEDWRMARRATTKRAIFVSWWAHEMYRVERDSNIYKTYWGEEGKMTGEERQLAHDVSLLYGDAMEFVNGTKEIAPEQIAWFRWYSEEKVGDPDMVLQEMPWCVTGDTRVGTRRGIIPITAASCGDTGTYGRVVDTRRHGPTVVYQLTTALGYSLRGTADHPMITADDSTVNLSTASGKRLKLCPPRFSDDQAVVSWQVGPITSEVQITGLLACLIGLFMGDGSFHVHNASKHLDSGSGTLGIACDAKDKDLITAVGNLYREVLGVEPQFKDQPGCVVVRAAGSALTILFRRLGLLTSQTGPTRRKVHVPEFIFRSPKNIVAQFLSGLFEADGFNDYQTSRVMFFSKHLDFLKDIQLLLLGFGVTCKRKNNELALRKQEAEAFNEQIGFLSERKRRRSKKRPAKCWEKSLVMEDDCISVAEAGVEYVYNLTIENGHLFDANGLLTHNTEHQAFVVTGAQYFTGRDLTEAHKVIAKDEMPQYLRVEIRHTMTDSQVLAVPRKVSNLTVWAGPVEGAQYVLGADPAFGSSDWADRFAISVWRCYADRLEQVAEYCTPDGLPYSFAWVMAYLAGCYAPCAWNLEVTGPGAAVLGEIDNLKRQQFHGTETDRRTMKNFLGGMKEFLYARPDQISRLPTARGTASTLKEKRRYFDTYKGYFHRGMLGIHSRDLLEEMKWVTVEAGEAPRAAGRRKDDRVIAACLACQMWHDKLRAMLMAKNATFTRTAATPARLPTVLEQIVARQQKLLGLRKA
jgi:hypothetical protein